MQAAGLAGAGQDIGAAARVQEQLFGLGDVLYVDLGTTVHAGEDAIFFFSFGVSLSPNKSETNYRY